MKGKIVSGIVLTLLLTGMLTLAFNIQSGKAATITVPDDYPTIQQAVDAANPGDTIYVRAGEYHERVYIGSSTSGRSQLRIVGEDPSNTIVDTSSTGMAPGPFNIWQSDHITITGFTVTTVGYGVGIDLHGSQYCNITGNRILASSCNIALQNDCHYNLITNNVLIDGLEGIYLFSSWGAFPCTSNTIMNNDITSKAGCIHIEYCDDNVIMGNTLISTAPGPSHGGGIMISYSSGCFLRNNHLAGDFPFEVSGDSVLDYIHDIDTSNTVDGKPIYYWINEHDKTIPSDAGVVYVVNSTSIRILDLDLKRQTSAVNLISTSGSIIHNTTAKSGGIGIRLLASSDNVVDDNTLYSNMGLGLLLGSQAMSSQNNTIFRNNITDNQRGILIPGSSYNTIVGNNLTNNEYGVWLSASFNNKFHHNNFIYNTQQVYITTAGYVDIWDNGYPSGGNYWSDYTGADLYRGLYQNETGSDGIGDIPYSIDADNQDHYPLMNPYPSIHAVSAKDIRPHKTVVAQGFTADLSVDIANSGAFTETFNVTVYINTTAIGTKTVTSLPSEAKQVLTFTWNTSGLAKGNYTISAYAWPVPNETDTTDNTFVDGWVMVAMVGDIASIDKQTGKVVDIPDGKVDITDIAKIARLFGVIYPDLRYDPDCDLTGPIAGVPDEKIDIRDIATVAKHFGEVDP